MMTNFANEPLITDAWYIAGWSHELSDGPVARRIMDEDVVLFRTVNGKAGALEDRCCHRGVRLSLVRAPMRNPVRLPWYGFRAQW